jgi:hypothetical protein
MTTTLRHFCEGVDVVKVEAERFPTLAQVKRESFGSPDHRAMLVVHQAELVKFATREHRRLYVQSVEGDVDGATRLAIAFKESMEYSHRKRIIPGVPLIADTLAQHRAQPEFDLNHQLKVSTT